MSARDVARNAPYLRRYARALTGSQIEGDAAVEATLRRILEGGLDLDPGFSPKTGLFRAFHQSWQGFFSNRRTDPAALRAADRRLQALKAGDRAAMLLVLMEGFSFQEAGAVLGAQASAVEESFDAAQDGIERQLTTQALIIEDEPIVALDLERLVLDLGHDLVGVAATRTEAVDLARRGRPGLVLADVRLADGSSGLDAVTDILESFDIPVIFITAFPERLLTGERAEPAFLISKPFREETVKAMIGQALFFHQPQARAVA